MDALGTTMGSYRTLNTLASATAAVDTDLAAATGYGIGAPTGSVDLQAHGGANEVTTANAVSLVLNATGALATDTLTQKIYGITDQGPPQLIASIVWTMGTALADGTTAGYLWAGTAVVTSTHASTIVAADSASNRVCSVSFDCTGFRYLYGLITAQTGDPLIITSLYRYW